MAFASSILLERFDAVEKIATGFLANFKKSRLYSSFYLTGIGQLPALSYLGLWYVEICPCRSICFLYDVNSKVAEKEVNQNDTYHHRNRGGGDILGGYR